MNPFKINFIDAVKMTCTSTSCFVAFINQKLPRALAHLLLLLLISCGLIATSSYFYHHNEVKHIGTVFDQTFGTFSVNDSGIHFEKSIDSQMEHFFIMPSVAFDYYPSKSAFLDTEIFTSKALAGVQLDSHMLLMWAKAQDGYVVLPMIAPKGLGIESNAFLEPDLKSVRNRSANIIFDPNQKVEYISLLGPQFKVSNLASDFFMSYLIMNKFIASTVLMFILIMIIGSLFSLSSFIFATQRVRKIFSFSRNLVQITYASFPPIILATIYTILNINFLGFTYSEIVIYGLIFYSFFIQINVQRRIIILNDENKN